MGTSATFVVLLAVLVAWQCSPGYATPIPSSTPVPSTTSVSSTTKPEEVPQQSTEGQLPQLADEPVHVPQEQAEVPQEPEREPQEPNNPVQEPQEGLYIPEPFREQFPLVVPGFVVPANPDGQTDGTRMEMAEMEPREEQMDSNVQQEEMVPEQMRREPEEQSEVGEEETIPEQMQREPEEQSEVGVEATFPEQMMRREPEEQSEMGMEEMSDFNPAEDTRQSQVQFRKPMMPAEEFQSFPVEDSPHFNEVEGIYANQQEGLLPQDIRMVDISMMEFHPME